MTRKNTTVRSSAAVTAALLMTALTAGPAMADHDHGQGKSRDGAGQSAEHRQDGDRAKDRRAASHAERGTEHRAANQRGDRGDERGNGTERGRGDERGNGHTPVTVCHLLGNGGYHLLTMDDNALSAHLRHGDVYPGEDGTCPAATATVPDESTTETETEESTTEESTTETETEESTTEESTTETETEESTTETDRTGAVVMGEEAFAGTRTGTTVKGEGATVAGVEATRGANRAAPVAGPVAGILPQTGAGALLSGALVAGAGLVAGGLALAARRRQGAL